MNTYNHQKGSVTIIAIIIVLAALIGGGYFLYQQNNKNINVPNTEDTSQQSLTTSPEPIATEPTIEQPVVTQRFEAPDCTKILAKAEIEKVFGVQAEFLNQVTNTTAYSSKQTCTYTLNRKSGIEFFVSIENFNTKVSSLMSEGLLGVWGRIPLSGIGDKAVLGPSVTGLGKAVAFLKGNLLVAVGPGFNTPDEISKNEALAKIAVAKIK